MDEVCRLTVFHNVGVVSLDESRFMNFPRHMSPMITTRSPTFVQREHLVAHSLAYGFVGL